MNWVFQYNPSRYDLLAELEKNSFDGNWNMNQNRDVASVDDRVFFWRSGRHAALTATGRITSPVYRRESEFGRFAVDVECDGVIEPPIARDEILAVSKLSSVAVFRGWQGTNLLLDDLQAHALEELVAGRVRQVTYGEFRDNATRQVGLTELSAAISRNNNRVEAELRDIVQAMDPRAFEFLVQRVLLALGYRDVTVTRYSGDKGIDVRAAYDVGGATPVAVAIQAKRMRTVDRPIVQSLRGSLTSRELGLLITSGALTAGAMAEAEEPGKIPIGLIDGLKLVKIMVENGIGVEERSLPALRLIPEALSLDSLISEVPPQEP